MILYLDQQRNKLSMFTFLQRCMLPVWLTTIIPKLLRTAVVATANATNISNTVIQFSVASVFIQQKKRGEQRNRFPAQFNFCKCIHCSNSKITSAVKLTKCLNFFDKIIGGRVNL